MKKVLTCVAKATICMSLLSSISSSAQDLKIVPYEEGFYKNNATLSPAGIAFKTLYDAYVAHLEVSTEYMIPNLIHFIWLGSEVPERCKIFVATWQKYHPDWIIKVWTDADVASFNLQNQVAFDTAKNYGEKADILRYEILYRLGGLYVDTDFECLRSFESIHKSCEFYTGMNDGNPVEILNGLIGSRPGHPIMKSCMDNLRTGNGDHSLWRILDYTGPQYFTRIFLAHAEQYKNGEVVAFPPSFFYPMPNLFKERMDIANLKQEFIKPESFAIHWWDVSWMTNINLSN